MKRRIAVLLVLGILPWAELHAQAADRTNDLQGYGDA